MTTRRSIVKAGAGLAAILAAGRAPAAFVRSMLGARGLVMGGGAKLSAKSYVQDGLVAMWDGIENAGWGVHDANATVWVDLVGGRQFVKHTNSSAFSWGSDALHTEEVCFGGSFTDLATTISDVFTVESVFRPGGTSGWKYLWSICVNAQNINRWAGITSNNSNRLAVVSNNAGQAAGRVDIGIAIAASLALSVSVVYSPPSSASLVYRDGGYLSSASSGGAYTGNITSAAVTVGGLYYSNDRAQKCDSCNLRLYSRALTADEIAANYAVDKARFNLPDAT